MDIIKGQITRDQIALLSIALTFRLATNVPHMRNAIATSNYVCGLLWSPVTNIHLLQATKIQLRRLSANKNSCTRLYFTQYLWA